MTTTRIPLVAQINVTIVSQAVTAAYGSNGDLVNYSAACSSVLLRNPGEVWPIEFKVGSGAWQRLEIYNTTLLGISLDTTTIRVRKALANSGSGLVQLDIRGLASTYLAGDDAVDLGGEGGGAAAFTDLTDAPATLTPNQMLVTNAEGTALMFAGSTLAVESFSVADAAATKSLGVTAFADTEYSAPDGTATLTGQCNPGADSGTAILELAADSSLESAALSLTATVIAGNPLAILQKNAQSVFRMTNFDVVATDATATMTVAAVQYSIAKAIKVQVGGSTYFWPLFGPVA